MENAYSYRAVPADSRFIELAGRNTKFVQFFRNLNAFIGADALAANVAGEAELGELIAELQRLSEAHTGIEDRYLCSVRTWDILLYLISDYRRGGGKNSDSEWMHEAVKGGRIISGTTVSDENTVRYLDPTTVIEFSNRLSAIPTNTLIINWDPPAMVKASVAQSSADDGFDILARAEVDFNSLKEFYWKVSEKNEGILTFCS